MWSTGTILIPEVDGDVAVRYEVKHYPEPSEFGIDDGRISKLCLRIDGVIVANYDRGWDKEPEEEAAVLAFAALINRYN
jgi:hypothetical protein